MKLLPLVASFLTGVLIVTLLFISCTKEPEKVYPPRHILYSVKGTHFKLNFIDSNSVFQRDQVFQDSFHYEFLKGPGATIGVSIFTATPDDVISSWNIYIDGKLTANAFSEGGAYLEIPYN